MNLQKMRQSRPEEARAQYYREHDIEDFDQPVLGPQTSAGSQDAGMEAAPATRREKFRAEFDRFFAGADRIEDYYDDSFRIYSRLGIVLFSFLCAFLIWGYFATIDEVSRGEGKVVPSLKTQVVQSLEGGIAKEILVRQGQQVKRGQTLILLDDTGFSSSMGELNAKKYSLTAQVLRLRFETESESGNLVFPEDLTTAAPDVVANELRLFQTRRTNFANQSAILNERLQQKKIELSELQANLLRFGESLKLAQREYEIKAPLAQQKVVPETELLRIQREIADLSGQIRTGKIAEPRLQAAITEAERQVEDHKLSFRQTAQQELTQKIGELNVVDQSLKGAKDRVFRTDIKSPVDGVINKLNFTTLGGVIRPGESIAEIVPLEDALLIEVKIKPSDIAFIHLKQEAIVRLTAYDFSVYGSLRGNVVNVAPDSITDPTTKETYYTVVVQTKEVALKRQGESLPIFPGMVATVDIITGSKSILQYLLKPIVKARDSALRER